MEDKKITGINYIERINRWQATFCYEQKKEVIGTYDTYEEALLARLKREKEVYGQIDNIYKRQRLLLHLSKKDVAEKAGLSSATYANFENQKRSVSTKSLEKIEKVLQIEREET